MTHKSFVLGVVMATLLTGQFAYSANELDQSMSAAKENQSAGAASQQKVDALYELILMMSLSALQHYMKKSHRHCPSIC